MEDFLNLPFREIVHSESAAYTNLQRLGRGGSAETYLMLASAGVLRGQLFAVKVFRRLSKPEWQTSFLQEVAFLKGCDHPSVMRVYDEGVLRGDNPFVVADYLPNTLTHVLQTLPNMMAKMAYAVQLISALEYLARPEISVVHRDIKPDNIFVKGSACVLGDFGLVKRATMNADLDREMVKASIGPGMPRHYRTPDLVEYYKGGPVPTCKSDVYQLGLVFAEMFSGSNPQKSMANEDYAAPVEMRPFEVQGGLGEPIRDRILSMLESDPSKRPLAAELVAPWQDLFLVAAERSHALEGRVV